MIIFISGNFSLQELRTEVQRKGLKISITFSSKLFEDIDKPILKFMRKGIGIRIAIPILTKKNEVGEIIMWYLSLTM